MTLTFDPYIVFYFLSHRKRRVVHVDTILWPAFIYMLYFQWSRQSVNKVKFFCNLSYIILYRAKNHISPEEPYFATFYNYDFQYSGVKFICKKRIGIHLQKKKKICFCRKWRNYRRFKISGEIWSPGEIWFFTLCDKEPWMRSGPSLIWTPGLLSFIYVVLVKIIFFFKLTLICLDSELLTFKRKAMVSNPTVGKNLNKSFVIAACFAFIIARLSNTTEIYHNIP